MSKPRKSLLKAASATVMAASLFAISACSTDSSTDGGNDTGADQAAESSQSIADQVLNSNEELQ